MFGYVTANVKELSKAQRQRYNAVYCGICRRIRSDASQAARLALSYDMAFLSLLLMSLYEPAEVAGDRACLIHPLQKRSWVDNEYIGYGADMNVALAYYKAGDDVADDGKLSARVMAKVFGKSLPQIRARYPRQCDAMEDCIRELSALERDNCGNPDLPAGCFGRLMGELLVYREDYWAPTLGNWDRLWVGLSICWMPWRTTAGTVGKTNTTPSWPWAPGRIWRNGNPGWCWKWPGVRSILKSSRWSRTSRCWTAS